MHKVLSTIDEKNDSQEPIVRRQDNRLGKLPWALKNLFAYYFGVILLTVIPSEGSSATGCRNLQHYPKLSQSEATILYHDKKIFHGCCWKFIDGLQMADEAVVFLLEHQVLPSSTSGCNNALKFPEESYKCEPDIKNNTCWVYTKRFGSCTIDQIKMALAPKNLTCSLTLQKLESTDGTKLDPEVCFDSKGAEAMFELHYFPVTCFDTTTWMTASTTLIAEKTESTKRSTSETSLISMSEKTTKKFKTDTSVAAISKTTPQTTGHTSKALLSTVDEIFDTHNSDLSTQKSESMAPMISSEHIIAIAAAALILLLVAISATLFFRRNRQKQQISSDKSTSDEGNINRDEPSNSCPTDDKAVVIQNHHNVLNTMQGYDTSEQEDVYTVMNKQTKINEVESNTEQKIGNAESSNDAGGDIYATVQKI